MYKRGHTWDGGGVRETDPLWVGMHKRGHVWGGGDNADTRGVNLSCIGRQAQTRGAVNTNMHTREVDTLGVGVHK